MSNQKYNTITLIEKFKEIHGNLYDYSQIEYKSYKEKVKVICKKHGVFLISISKHLQGQGCPECRYIKSANKKRRSVDEVILEAKNVHGDKYDYSLITEYKNTKTKLPIICKEHGIFYQTYDNHVRNKQNCPQCALIQQGIDNRLTTNEFIEKAKLIHNDDYDYSLVNYNLSEDKVDIICSKHGVFSQIARNHLQGQGCPKCFFDKSYLEKEILEFIKEILPNIDIIENDREILEGKEIDIYIPSLQIGFEINGLIWHSEKYESNKNALLEKTEKCKLKNVRLIHIFEDDWFNKKEIIKSRIKNILNLTDNKIFGRKCEIKEVNSTDSKNFLNKNHIQGFCVSKYRYGLYYNNELVSLMTFGYKRCNVGSKNKSKEDYELLRFCNKINTNVIGGASKLFKHFLKTHQPKNVISYADKCWSIGNLYEKIGFIKYNESKPSYYYVVNKKRVNRFSLRKDVLIKKYKCPKNITEHQFCKEQGWYRIYDCGCLCYVYK